MTPSNDALPADTRVGSLQDRIAQQAKSLWEGYGRPSGRDVEIWLEAERQVLGADGAVNKPAGTGAVAAKPLVDSLTPKRPAASTPDARSAAKARKRTG